MKALSKRLFGIGMAAVMLASGGAVPSAAFDADEVSSAVQVNIEGLARPSVVKTQKGSSAVNLRWKRVDKATGYKVFMKTKNGWKCKAVVKGGNKLSAKVQGLDSKTKYTFKVQAFKKSKGKTYYSRYSAPVTVETAYGVGNSNWTNRFMSVRFNSKRWGGVEGNKDTLTIANTTVNGKEYAMVFSVTLMDKDEVMTTNEMVDVLIEFFDQAGIHFEREGNVVISGKTFATISTVIENENDKSSSVIMTYYLKASGRRCYSIMEAYDPSESDITNEEFGKVLNTVKFN